MTKDRTMILNPFDWPLYPFLPLKRRNNSLEEKNLGFLIPSDGGGITVYHGYVFDGPFGKEKFATLPRTEYANVNDLLADGWIVD